MSWHLYSNLCNLLRFLSFINMIQGQLREGVIDINTKKPFFPTVITITQSLCTKWLTMDWIYLLIKFHCGIFVEAHWLTENMQSCKFSLILQKSSLKINQSVHVWMNKFDNLPDYGNVVPFMLNVILNVSLIAGQNLPDCKMQIFAALAELVSLQTHDVHMFWAQINGRHWVISGTLNICKTHERVLESWNIILTLSRPNLE